MLNGEFLNQQADALADRLRREAGDDAAAQVRLALRLATGRDPSEADVDARHGPDRIALAGATGSGRRAPARRSAWWR